MLILRQLLVLRQIIILRQVLILGQMLILHQILILRQIIIRQILILRQILPSRLLHLKIRINPRQVILVLPLFRSQHWQLLSFDLPRLLDFLLSGPGVTVGVSLTAERPT